MRLKIALTCPFKTDQTDNIKRRIINFLHFLRSYYDYELFILFPFFLDQKALLEFSFPSV